jgi:hypothetical protein
VHTCRTESDGILTRKNFLTVLIVLILVGITAYFVVESLIPSSPFIPEYNATYGVYRIPVYYPNNTITYLTVEGVKLTLNNQDQNALQISSVYNSTFKVVPLGTTKRKVRLSPTLPPQQSTFKPTRYISG